MRLLWALILASCLSSDQDVNDLIDGIYDQDGDGYDAVIHGGEDCDDEDARIYPGAHDFWYDGVDSDCGFDSDFDADLDGQDSADYGGTDCDDTRADVYLNATELCGDGIDNDCNEEIDEVGCQ
jgi:hypothetical protein